MKGTDKETDREWMRTLGGLPRQVSPRRDPWPEIAVRIAGEDGVRAETFAARAGRPWWPLAAAAAVVASLGIVLWMNAFQPATVSVDSAALPGRVPAYAGSLRATDAEYRAALQEFGALQSVGLYPDGSFSGHADRGWVTMIEAENELAAALRRDPDDIYIKERLVQLRARQLEMLRQIASASMASRRQTI